MLFRTNDSSAIYPRKEGRRSSPYISALDTERFLDQYGNDIDEDGLLGLDRLVYYDAPSGINANLIHGVIQDGYGSVDQVYNFERFYGSFYDDTITLSNDLPRGYLPAYGDDTIIGLDTPDGPNNSHIAYFNLHVDDDLTIIPKRKLSACNISTSLGKIIKVNLKDP